MAVDKKKPRKSLIPLWNMPLVQALSILVLLSVSFNVWNHANLPNTIPSSSQGTSAILLDLPLPQQSTASTKTTPPFWKSNQPGIQQVKTDKKGNVLHQGVAKLDQSVLDALLKSRGGASSSSTAHLTNLTLAQARQGREELIQILTDAGISMETTSSSSDNTEAVLATILSLLPTWKEVTDLYGTTPVIYGLETACSAFQRDIPRDDASVGVSGLFNTGTNPLAMYLSANCIMPNNTHDKAGKGMRWQVPWGKHMLASRKWTNTAGHDDKVNKTNVLPVVLIRDPYSWMQSMCKHSYAAKWIRGQGHRCPNLVPSANEQRNGSKSFAVTVDYPNQPAHFDSLADFWSEWYNEYINAEYPRLVVRFEDLIFHQRELIGQICQCAGAVPKGDTFVYVVGEGKWGAAHKGSSNMISAMIKYGKSSSRLAHLTEEDLVWAQYHIDPGLMKLFHYKQPTLSAVS